MTAWTSSREAVDFGRTLGEGGEGVVRAIRGQPGWVAKLYHPDAQDPDRLDKLKLMISAPPADPMASRGVVSLAWPREVLLDDRGRLVGFVMPAIDVSRSYCIHQLWKPKQRPDGCTMGHLVRVARNLASVVGAVHAGGYVIGDVNESNFLVTDTSRVILVDCDSMQVRRPGRAPWLCDVHKPEFTPPELQDGFDFGAQERTPGHDRFGLAVLLFQLLMLGRHPYSGGLPNLVDNVRASSSWVVDGGVAPPVGSPALQLLSPEVLSAFRLAFAPGVQPDERPTADEWVLLLRAFEQSLVPCSRRDQHSYPGHLDGCPWCGYRRRFGFDPFEPTSTEAAYREARRAVRSAAIRPRPARPLRGSLPGAAAARTNPGRAVPRLPRPRPEDHLPPASVPGERLRHRYRPRRSGRLLLYVFVALALVAATLLLVAPYGAAD